jgi:hypothetical protein
MKNTVPALPAKKKRRALPLYRFLMLSYGGWAKMRILDYEIRISLFAKLAGGLLLALL